jgi:hypothetical protein
MKKMRFVLVFIMVTPFLINAQQKGIDYSKELKKVNSTDYSKIASKLATEIKSKGYKVEKSLPAGYVKDGSVDYTSEIQTALNDHQMLIFPNFPILVNETGLKLKSDQKILFEDGSVLLMKPNENTKYNVLDLSAVSNVSLINPVIKGDRAGHLGTRGEWGHGIGLYGSSNTMIFNPKITDCWGDGIYFGTTKVNANVTNKNSAVVNAFLKNNRRNNCSVISVDGLYLIKPYFGFGNGTEPQDGIDFEPNNTNDELKNIYIIDPVTEENVNEGIQICLSSWYKVVTGAPVKKEISFIITNHKDTKSGWAVYLSYRKNEHPNTTVTVDGIVRFVNPDWTNNTKAVIRNGIRDPGVMTSFINPKITINGVVLNKAETKAKIEEQAKGGKIEIIQN